MTTNDYHFVDRWRVEGDIKEVADILEDALSLPQWWGSVYFEVKEIKPGGEHGIGKLISLRAGGDLEGKGIWTFEPHGPFVNVTYDWTIRANKPIIEKLSFLLKPIFRSNHNWTMKRGEESLKLELMRRRAKTTGETSAVPAPPRPSLAVRLFQLNRHRA